MKVFSVVSIYHTRRMSSFFVHCHCAAAWQQWDANRCRRLGLSNIGLGTQYVELTTSHQICTIRSLVAPTTRVLMALNQVYMILKYYYYCYRYCTLLAICSLQQEMKNDI